MDPRLVKLRELKPNWDSYGAEPPNEIALALADEFLKLAPCDRVSATVMNGVALSYREKNNPKHVFIEFHNDSECVVGYLDDTASVDECGFEEFRSEEFELVAASIRNFIYGL